MRIYLGNWDSNLSQLHQLNRRGQADCRGGAGRLVKIRGGGQPHTSLKIKENLDKIVFNRFKANRHLGIQTSRHTAILTYRHPDTQTYRHSDIQTSWHTDILTYRHSAYRNSEIQTFCIQKFWHTDILTYRHSAYRNSEIQTSSDCSLLWLTKSKNLKLTRMVYWRRLKAVNRKT